MKQFNLTYTDDNYYQPKTIEINPNETFQICFQLKNAETGESYDNIVSITFGTYEIEDESGMELGNIEIQRNQDFTGIVSFTLKDDTDFQFNGLNIKIVNTNPIITDDIVTPNPVTTDYVNINSDGYLQIGDTTLDETQLQEIIAACCPE